MHELHLIGVHDDGEHVVLQGSDGQRYMVLIDEPLRAAARRDLAKLGQLQIAVEGGPRPRDIQARIRAGHSADQIAAEAGVPVEHVRRFEGPVLAERENVALRARQAQLRDGLRLGTVADERLAARGVDLDRGTRWDSWREDDGNWTVQVTFLAGGQRRAARWGFDLAAQHLTAADDEAKWLSAEHADAAQPPRRPRSTAPGPDTPEDSVDSGALDQILRRRFQTQEIATPWTRQETPLRGSQPARFPAATPSEEESGSASPAGIDELPPPAHPAHSHPEDIVDATVVQDPAPETGHDGDAADTRPEPAPEPASDRGPSEDEPGDEPLPFEGEDKAGASHQAPPAKPAAGREQAAGRSAPASRKPGGRKTRPSVPSWDDIVFGAKKD